MPSEWDLAGRRTKLTWPGGFFVTYDHLVTGEVTKIRENGAASGIGVLATFGYDPLTVAGQLGLRTSLTRGNGIQGRGKEAAASVSRGWGRAARRGGAALAVDEETRAAA